MSEDPAPVVDVGAARAERRERARSIMERLERSPTPSNSDLREALIVALEDIIDDA